ncbi:MAG: ATP-binding cassette domain-containing protein [Dermatophilus congolensis]|nr:ATP-binding cassette domain-containing protein [Dermatophilus congolensis]
MATVRFEAATRTYPGSDHASVDALSIDIGDGEFLVLVGPPGCGKSTTLRMLAGLEEVTEGRISIDGMDVTELPPKDRDVAMVFQNYALYPHMTVADNMGFALRIAGVPPEEISERVRRAAAILGLEEKLEARPQDLSGGQRQRVAMGRAIVREPKVFLMDEPLNNLEPELREQTRDQIAALQRQLGITTVYATCDQLEAMSIGDRVAVLNHGVLQQCDDPGTLYDRPANVFVAGYIGSPTMNTFPVRVTETGAKLGELEIPLDAGVREAAGDTVIIGVRPEDLTVRPEGSSGGAGITVLLETVESDQGGTYAYAIPASVTPAPAEALEAARTDAAEAEPGVPDADDDSDLMIVARVPDGVEVREGDTVLVAPDLQRLHFFHADTGLRLH